jgi:hypothetical protein
MAANQQGKDLQFITSYLEEMTNSNNSNSELINSLTKPKPQKKFKIDQNELKLLMNEFEMSKHKAENMLKNHSLDESINILLAYLNVILCGTSLPLQAC